MFFLNVACSSIYTFHWIWKNRMSIYSACSFDMPVNCFIFSANVSHSHPPTVLIEFAWRNHSIRKEWCQRKIFIYHIIQCEFHIELIREREKMKFLCEVSWKETWWLVNIIDIWNNNKRNVFFLQWHFQQRKEKHPMRQWSWYFLSLIDADIHLLNHCSSFSVRAYFSLSLRQDSCQYPHRRHICVYVWIYI